MKIALNVYWKYLDKRKNIFEIRKRKLLKFCNRVIEIYNVKSNHLDITNNIWFRKNDILYNYMIFDKEYENGFKRYKNIFLFKIYLFLNNVKLR